MRTLESSLLYIRKDQSQNFIHDTYKDFFLAKYFAAKINSGELSVKQTYEQFWSFKIDSDIWGVEGRSVLPAWQSPIGYLSELLNEPHARTLAKILTSSFFKAKKMLKYYEMNPFSEDLIFFAFCCNSLRVKNKRLRERTVISLIRMYPDFLEMARDALAAIGGEEVSERVVSRYYSLSFCRGNGGIDIIYILCKVNKEKAVEYFRNELRETVDFLRSNDAVMSSDEEFWKIEWEDLLKLFYVDLLPVDELKEKYQENIFVESLVKEFEILVEALPKKKPFDFSKSLLNDPDEKIRRFVRVFLSTSEKNYERVKQEKDKLINKETDPWVEEYRNSLFPSLEGNCLYWGLKPFPYYKEILLRRISNEDVIQNFAGSSGQEQIEAAVLIKNRKIVEAEPVCLEKIKRGALKEKIYSAWLLKYIGSTRSVPYLRGVLHQSFDESAKVHEGFDEQLLCWFTKEAIFNIYEKNVPLGYNPNRKQ